MISDKTPAPKTSHYALVDMAEQYWERRNLFRQKKKLYTPAEILADVCAALGSDPDLIRGKSRKREVALVRHIYCFVAKLTCDIPLKRIGDEMGGRDHTTVIHSCQTIHDLMQTKNQQFLDYWDRFMNNSKLFTIKQLTDEIPPTD